MIYGNHNKRKGDIVVIARWDKETTDLVGIRYCAHDGGDLEFIVADIDYYTRTISLRPNWNNLSVKAKDAFKTTRVFLDETNLIRVGRL